MFSIVSKCLVVSPSETLTNSAFYDLKRSTRDSLRPTNPLVLKALQEVLRIKCKTSAGVSKSLVSVLVGVSKYLLSVSK